MYEIIKNYLYANDYFLQIKCISNDNIEYINNYLDNKFMNETKLSIFDVLNTIENISNNVKDIKITIVYKDDIISMLEIKNYKIIKYYHKEYKSNVLVEVSYNNRSGLKISILDNKFLYLDINNMIKDDLNLIFDYKKREKEYKTLVKTNDKKKKM